MKKLTVAEYAKLHGISQTAVYKKLKRLETVEEVINGRKTTLILEPEGEGEQFNPIQPNSTQIEDSSTPIQPQKVENQPTNSTPFQPQKVENQPSNSTPIQPSYIAILEKQLEEKDKQIERLQEEAKEKDRQLQEQFDRLSSLLLRSQELEALTHKLLLGQGEETREEPIVEDTEDIETHTEEPIQDTIPPEKKKSWFRRLFKR